MYMQIYSKYAIVIVKWCIVMMRKSNNINNNLLHRTDNKSRHIIEHHFHQNPDDLPPGGLCTLIEERGPFWSSSSANKLNIKMLLQCFDIFHLIKELMSLVNFSVITAYYLLFYNNKLYTGNL